MKPNHQEKAREAIREAAAEFLAREAERQSLITVTNAEISKDGCRAIVYITVLPDSSEHHALAFANRHRGEFAEFLKKRVCGIPTPHLEFAIDRGEKNRQKLETLLNNESAQ